jgi:prevent-host-death family protein
MYVDYVLRGVLMGLCIKTSEELKNNYSEISKQCRETREAVIITLNGRGDTVILGLQDYKQMKAELDLLRILAEAEDDVQNLRVDSMQESIDSLRDSLIKRKNEDV